MPAPLRAERTILCRCVSIRRQRPAVHTISLPVQSRALQIGSMPSQDIHCLSCSAPFKAAAAQIAQPSAFASQSLATAPRSMPLLCPALCCHSMFSPCQAGLAVQSNAVAILPRQISAMPLRLNFNQGRCLSVQIKSLPLPFCPTQAVPTQAGPPLCCSGSLPIHPINAQAPHILAICTMPWPILPILCFALADLGVLCYAQAILVRAIPCHRGAPRSALFRCGASHFYANPSRRISFP